MATRLIAPLLGRHLAFTIQAMEATIQTSGGDAGKAYLAASAVTGFTSAFNLSGRFQNAGFGIQPEHEEISGDDATRKNHVIVADDDSFQISEIAMRGSGSTVRSSLLMDLFNKFDYFKIVATIGASTYTYYAVRGEIVGEMSGKGKKMFSIQLRCIDARETSDGTPANTWV